MKTLLKNGTVVNVFTGELETANVLIENDRILGVGAYVDADAEIIADVSGKFICPGFLDGHIHIESTMLLPSELARICLLHGTTTIVVDPHEIANVCGTAGIDFMLEASKDIPLNVYFTLPSCVPSTSFDESGATLSAKELNPYYRNPRVVGLGEVMTNNFQADLVQKIADAKANGRVVNGHAPLLSGKLLDRYVSMGIQDDHECSSFEEAKERIRQGTTAQNLPALLPLFDSPYAHRCLLVTDDKHAADLLAHGHIDEIIRQVVQKGKSVITAIQMATIQAAQCFCMKDVGAVTPGYIADLLVLDDLATVHVCDVYCHGEKIVCNQNMKPFEAPSIPPELLQTVRNTVCMNELTEEDFFIAPNAKHCRVIKVIPGELLTEEYSAEINWETSNGIDPERDLIKLAVIERHRNTGHIGKGFLCGMGLRHGAIASTVSHDAHNMIVIGANDADMAVAANHVRRLGGGFAVADGGSITAEMPLPIAGLISDLPAAEATRQNEAVRAAAGMLGIHENMEPFMLTAFMSLPVIPHLKMTTKGLVDVDNQKLVSLYL